MNMTRNKNYFIKELVWSYSYKGFRQHYGDHSFLNTMQKENGEEESSNSLGGGQWKPLLEKEREAEAQSKSTPVAEKDGESSFCQRRIGQGVGK